MGADEIIAAAKLPAGAPGALPPAPNAPKPPDYDDVAAWGLSLRGMITFMVMFTVCLLVIIGKSVPEIISDMAFVCLGFYFNKGKS